MADFFRRIYFLVFGPVILGYDYLASRGTRLLKSDEYGFKYIIQRKSDGKFFRGATRWPWVYCPKNAAFLPRVFIKDFYPHFLGDDYRLISIEEIM